MTESVSSANDRAQRRFRVGAAVGLVLAGVLLAAHVWSYRFLTDDAYISFRYARNLAEGHGLVFNPGGEAVEGYTNFLWVMLLAGFVRLGFSAESIAPYLSMAATAGLWLAATFWGWRFVGRPQRLFVFLLVPVALASNRNFAVWATGGLETRLFDLLVLLGLALLWREWRQLQRHQALAFPWASLVLALAVLTRPDAIVIGGGALLVREIALARGGLLAPRGALARWLVFVLPIVAHVGWRLHYYGESLPNTFYAKSSGRFFGDLGVIYFAMFVVEYGLLLWAFFLVDGLRVWSRRAAVLPWLLLAAFAPYLAYVAYTGGDHFEFRPLSVLSVPLVLLFQSAVADRVARARQPSRQRVYAFAFLALIASVPLPAWSHRHFPKQYVAGFPGVQPRPDGDRSLVRAGALPPVVRTLMAPWVATHNELGRRLTGEFAAVRAEEHKLFLRSSVAVGLALRRMVDDGTLPKDTKIAVDCVGALPYHSRLWTLDRLGLCDAQVAHGPWRQDARAMAHNKRATREYVASRGVDLAAQHNWRFFVDDATVRFFKDHPEAEPYVARLGPNHNMLVHFPQGPIQGLARFPKLPFEPVETWQPTP